MEPTRSTNWLTSSFRNFNYETVELNIRLIDSQLINGTSLFKDMLYKTLDII